MAGVTSVVIDGTTYLVDDINAVDFSEDQGLSEQQQQQGRSNIGAAAEAALAGKADKTDLNALAGTVGDLSDDVDGLTEAMADKADVIVDTASGAVASFPDGAAVPAKDITIGIEPVQDLHGFENPWPGGGGKNLLPMKVDGIKELNPTLTWVGNSTTYYEVAITIITDDGGNVTGITTNGTATSTCVINIAQYSLTAGIYVLNGCPSGGSTSSYYMDWRSDSGSQLIDAGTGSTYTSAGQSGYMSRVIIGAGINVSGKTFYPMIREASQSATFSPYSNICPISGWTGANVTRTGKNLYVGSPSFDGYQDRNTYSLASETYNGHEVIYKTDAWSGAYKRNTILLKAGLTYTFSAMVKLSTTANVDIYNGSNTRLWHGSVGTSWTKISATFTPVADMFASLRVESTTNDATIYLSEYQLELGSTATDYAACQSTLIPISWQSIAGTVYGGTLDVTTGLLTVDRSMATINGNTSWITNDNVGYLVTSGGWSSSNCIRAASAQTPADSNMFVNSGNTWADGFFGIENRTIWVSDRNFNIFGGLEGFKAALNTNPLQIVYPLVTPQTYQLTPTEVDLLLGDNNVWADTGDSTVTYRADTKLYIQKINAPTDDDMIADAQIASGRYFIIGGNLYKSTTTIPAGDAITPGTNCILTNLADALNALNT